MTFDEYKAFAGAFFMTYVVLMVAIIALRSLVTFLAQRSAGDRREILVLDAPSREPDRDRRFLHRGLFARPPRAIAAAARTQLRLSKPPDPGLWQLRHRSRSSEHQRRDRLRVRLPHDLTNGIRHLFGGRR